MGIPLFPIAAVVLISLALPVSGSADSTECTDWVARIVSAEGRVELLRSAGPDWKEVRINDILCPEDKVRTLEKSRAAILLTNETILRLDHKTMIKFSETRRPSLLEIIMGRVLFITRTPKPFTIDTPFVNAATEGTEFVIEVNEEEKTTTLTVIEGKMGVRNEAGQISIQSGQTAVTMEGQAPVSRFVIHPVESISWALYYPPALNFRELRLGEIDAAREGDWPVMVRRSIGFFMNGDVGGAFSALEGAPEGIRDARFYAYRASLLLSVGRIDEAALDLKTALDIEPRFTQALALQSIIAVVQNDREAAVKLALEATRTTPDSVSARVALSYAHQASFNLPAASAAIKEAVRLDPDSSIAWSRLAELLMAEGDIDGAMDAAKRAVALNPGEARARTILGFAYLAQIRISEAMETFDKAVTLSTGDPLARLGLGLAGIRKGRLEEGREEIEIAATLDPNNSLIRSYLGKAYYEEKRDDLAGVQLDMAKGLDPKDPTPWLYDAIRKQTQNRPVEALHDLQKSIELNDNRAVYRSRFLLDHDIAARSVSLARIYDDLGFRQAALVEGWKSVNIDPVNYSAHRLLADSYAALPRSEIARSSELLQAQLLQPVNSNPVQPRLGEGSSAILAGAGPLDTSVNEFSQLFNRDRVQLLAAGITGENDTIGGEVIVTGLKGRYSWSVGQFHHETDGFRENSGINQDIYNLFLQASLTHKLSVQGEIRFNDIESGDIDLRFDPDNFSPTYSRETETSTYRLGLHQTITLRSDIIVSILSQNLEFKSFDSSPVPAADSPPMLPTITVEQKTSGFAGEIQYLFRTEQININAGGGLFDSEVDSLLTFAPAGPLGPSFSFPDKVDTRHTNLYIYSSIFVPVNAALIIGASGDLYDGHLIDREQLNPKVGLTWNPLPSTTLRLAGFRVLKRDVVSNQTIEPAQVAGFQQFFDDADGADTWRYGAGIDHKFSPDLLGGVEISKRDIAVPVNKVSSTGGPAEVTEVDVDEALGRAYLYWTPVTWFASSAEYQQERSDSTDTTTPFGPRITTQRIPLGLNFYHPSGFIARFKGTYIKQKGIFLMFDPGTLISSFEEDEDQFWVVDASMGYRLPKRWGMFTIGARNMLDEDFRLQEIDFGNPSIQPDRIIFTRLTLSF